jgi:uncharacterized protein (TIGR00304 family)
MGFVVRLVRLLGPVLLAAGLAALFLAVVRGEATLYFVVFVPVIVASGGLAFLGILLAFLGFFTTFLFWPLRPPQDQGVPGSAATPAEPPARRWGGVVFLGPFPIVFGSDPRMARWMLVAGIFLFVALLALAIVALLG